MGTQLSRPVMSFPTKRAMTRYFRGFVIIVGLSLLVTLLTNLVVDPWRITPSPLSADGFDVYRDFRSQNRTGKCGLVRTAPEIGVALIGSSRVTNSLDPLNPNWNRNDVFNLGCNACFIYESEAFFRYLLEHHDPELVILGIDPGDLIDVRLSIACTDAATGTAVTPTVYAVTLLCDTRG